MSTLIVIPARLGATRLPGKPLRLLGGAPLIVRVWQRAQAMHVGDRVVVATDHPDVAAAARSAGAEVAMTRDDHASGTDRVAEVANRPAYAAYDVIVNVQGDEPYIGADAVRGAAEMVESGRFPLGTAAATAGPEILADPAIVKVVTDDAGRALYFSRAPIPFLRDSADRAQRDARLRQHLGVYAYRRDALNRWVSLPPHPLESIERLEQLRAIADGLAMGVATVAPVLGGGIDTEQDLADANARWSDATLTAGTS
ncbi:MAG: 3-deoxy-manno-octulosonate cytidylyltransferase [Gemmatimonadetes bacterium]|nr:3-deoxy-manno-octulosonate cytidylyltransferase [Gemmatimonadota bacterium]MBI3566846.1 3-deoxy-manno-octulosonate cytidylyltransferase [Gemmatimonadota bacterium]